MTTESAIVLLYRDIVAYFEAVDPKVSVVFGRRERWKQINQGTDGANRIVMMPGKLEDGGDGELGGVDGPGEMLDGTTATPRGLFRQEKVVTFSIWVADTTNDPQAQDEAQQEEVLEHMFELLLQALSRAPSGAAEVVPGSYRYNANPNELRFGIEYLAEFTLGTVYHDQESEWVLPSGAHVTRGAIT
jgi:hypothetical protein